ncbi:MAG: DNA modification methylase [Planctomycetes bacterium]|nr:DNA modification methylase [Planctomycetota bacterium]
MSEPNEVVKLSDLTPDSHNANKGTERGRHLLETSLSKYGAGRSILLDKNGRIIAGNKTAETAGEIGLEDVVIVRTDGKQLVAVMREDLDLNDDDTTARMLAYADNRVGAVSLDFDPEVLLADVTAGLDLGEFWFDNELEDLFADIEGYEPPDPKDAEPQISRADELQKVWQVETGQMWRLPSRTEGQEHRLICGDCTDGDVAHLATDGESLSLFYDPEWDDMPTPPIYTDALVFTDGYRAGGVIATFGSPAWVFVWDCVTSWYTPNRPLRRGKMCFWYGDIGDYDFNGSHYGDSGKARNVTNTRGAYAFVPDERGKHLSDVFVNPITTLHSDSDHSHSKPADWVRMLIANCTAGNIFDPFCGSGESIIAAENLSRQCRAVEISPAYVAVALQRYQDAFGIEPELLTN